MRSSQNVVTTGKLNHFGDPVSTDVERLQPFQKSNARALGGAGNELRNDGKALADLLQQLLGSAPTPSFLADPENVAPDVTKVLRVQAEHFRPIRETRQRGSQVVRRSSADVTQILRDDQIRREFLERLRINGVDALATGNKIAHQVVNFRGRGTLRNPRMNYHSLGTRLRRIVAFVTYANDFALESQREQNLRGRW